ncbi:cytochrome P450 monooxygenase [Purpureocillium lavendulum]|uniref:Cytochrome P450 monooxygenase n=1 Tax=Purpureocillium lavendulum TaxID=1247861 RepID=A0AB34FD29_9HYPO|nr:cytochrome P450 monooxygenase [Purpureocillium lavendulum]
MSSFDASLVINVSHRLLTILLLLVGAFVKKICGDMNDMYAAEGGRRRWVWSQPGKYGTVLCQAFLGPLRRPTVIVSDYETAVDICCRRTKEFDRGSRNKECVGFTAPYFHFTMESRDPRLKAHRKMLNGLMSQEFLHETAAERIYGTTIRLVALWTLKATKAQGNSFSAREDLYLATMDMISSVAFDMNEAQCSLTSSINQLKNYDSEFRLPTKTEILSLRVPYFDAVMEETLRCAAPATLITRKATCDTHIGEYSIPKGTDLIVCLAGPGMTEERSIEHFEKAKPAAGIGGRQGVPAWPDGDIATYNPGRWLKKETDSNGHVREIFDPKAGPNLAFSIGPRQCFGKKQALLQVKCMITLLLWSFDFDKVKSPLNSDENDRLNNNDIEESLVNRPKHCYVTAKIL